MSAASSRIALVVGAPAPDLVATTRDCARVFGLLTDPQLGGCDPDRSRHLPDCKKMATASEALQEMLSGWKVEEQFVLYVSGHGTIENDSYAILFKDTKKSYWRFPAILEELKANNVTRAILILDTCHSGAAQRTKDGRPPAPAGESNYVTPAKGIAILSACREVELAHERKDGDFSVYTDLLCEAIETGLEGDGQSEFIEVVAVNSYVKRKLQTPKYSGYKQTPNCTLRNFEDPIWLARNRNYRSVAAPATSPARPSLALPAVAVPAAVVVADVIDFSFHTPTAQRDILTALWQAASDALVKPAWLDLFADRLLGVFAEPQVVSDEQVMIFARGLLEKMRAAGATLRAAVHVGLVASEYFGGVSQGDTRRQAAKCYGRGINEAVRILEIAGPGELFVSEEFAQRLKQSGAPSGKRLYPDLASEENPIHVFGKVEVLQGVRLYRWDSAGKVNSPLVTLLTALDELILRELEEIERELLAGLKAKSSKLTPSKLKMRVSLLARQRDDSRRMLRSTAYRVAGFANAKQGELWTLTAPGRTTYSTDSPGVGPAGLAFVKYDVGGVFGLPDYAKKPKEYIQVLKDQTGLSTRTIMSFGRHARSFLCLPIGLIDTAPDLIVCIDCMHPLNTIDGLTDVALITGEDVRARHNDTLAALWRVRCST
jgi:class 3 adenylate cyclase